MKNIGQLMKQAQMMQNNLQKAQEEVRQIVVEGSAGGGLIKIVLGGDKVVKKVLVESAIIKDAIEDKTLLEDMIMIAVNEALKKLEEQEKSKMSAVTAGMPMPAGMRF